MNLPIQITYRNMEPHPGADEMIRGAATKLDHFFHHITSCRVMVEVPHRHHKRGRHFHVRIEIGVPGKELVVTREPSRKTTRMRNKKWTRNHEVQGPRKDFSFAVNDAFKEARRRVQDYTRCLRGDVKLHERVRPERAAKLGADQEG